MVHADVFLVGLAVVDVLQRDQLQLAVRHRAEVLAARLHVRRRRDLGERAGREPGGLFERAREAFAAHRFQHVADRACLEGVDRVLVVRGREHDGRRRIEPVQVLRGLDAVDSRHADVQQYDVRLRLGGEPDGLLAVRGLGDHLVLVEVVDQLLQAVARRLLVVNDQDLHGRVMPRPSRGGSAG